MSLISLNYLPLKTAPVSFICLKPSLDMNIAEKYLIMANPETWAQQFDNKNAEQKAE